MSFWSETGQKDFFYLGRMNKSVNLDQEDVFMKTFLHGIAYVTFATIFLSSSQVLAGAKIQIDDTKSWNIGAGTVSYTHLTLPTKA